MVPQFYGLFKQATVGDVNTPKPGMMQFVEKAKWTAWESNKGKSSEQAKKEYVEAFFAVGFLQLFSVVAVSDGCADVNGVLHLADSRPSWRRGCCCHQEEGHWYVDIDTTVCRSTFDDADCVLI